MSYNDLPPELLLIIANFLDTDDQLTWILTERRAFDLQSNEAYTRAIAEDEGKGLPEHLIQAADTGRLGTFKEILKRMKDKEINKRYTYLIYNYYIPYTHECLLYPREWSILHYLCHKGNEQAVL